MVELNVRDILKDMNLKQIQRWTLFSIVIGIVSGFGAIVFYLGLSAFSYYILGGIGGYYPPSPSGELPLFTIPQISPNKWLLILLPAAGGLLAGIIIYTFAPSLFIGAMVGGAFGQIMNLAFPEAVTQPGSYVLVGMGAMLAGAAKVPIAAIVMVSEMAGNYNLLAPLMVASTFSYLLSGRWSIYEKQVENRASSPAHRREMTVDLLERAEVKDAMSTNIVTIGSSLKIHNVFELIHKYGYTGFPVVDDRKLVGIITFEDAEKIPNYKRESTTVAEAMTVKLIVARPGDSLEEALKKLLDRNIGRLPVVDESDPTKLLGLVTKLDIMKAHARLSAER